MRMLSRFLTAGLLTVCLPAFAFLAEEGPALGRADGRDVGSCWWPRFEIVLSAYTGRPAKDADFSSAVAFFEANTGIDSNLELIFTGYVLDDRVARRSFARWLDWFVEQYPYLYWDQDRRLFEIDATAKRERRPTNLPRFPEDGDCNPPAVGSLKDLSVLGSKH